LARPLQEETDMIINYIRENTQEKHKWVLIGNRDFPKLFNISQLYAAKLLEIVKEDPHVLYEVDETFPSRFKPYRFHWVHNEQDKIDHGLTAKQFYWLNDEEIDYIKAKTKLSTYEKMSKILKLCNLLVGDGGKEWWISPDFKELADLTVSTLRETEQRIELLLNNHLLIKAELHNLYRLALNPTQILEIKQEAKQKKVPLKPKQTRKKRKSPGDEKSLRSIAHENILKNFENFNRNLENNGEFTQIGEWDINPITYQDHNPASKIASPTIVKTKSVLEGAKLMEQVMMSSLGQLQEQIEQLTEIRECEEGTQRSYEAFMKLSSEHESTKEKLSKCELKLRQFENEVRLLCEYNEAFVSYAQVRMDVLLGTISGIVDEYVKRPKYEQNDEIINSRLKKSIWVAVEDASEKITNYKPEDKFPPKER
jgi:hypothetical protein